MVNTKKYTERGLKMEIERHITEVGRLPTRADMCPANGYPSFATYDYRFANEGGFKGVVRQFETMVR